MTERKKLLNHIQNTIDDWTNEAIYDFDLYGVVEYETVKKLILFGATTIAYELDDEEDEE
jgi:hypothetical protein